jgi:hypothetical protein
VKAHGFASPSFDGFALSRMKGVAIQARQSDLPQSRHQNWRPRLLIKVSSWSAIKQTLFVALAAQLSCGNVWGLALFGALSAASSIIAMARCAQSRQFRGSVWTSREPIAIFCIFTGWHRL